ncbi:MULTISPECIES: UDP-N-acetyl-D-mannosamine dehydrogenase [Rhodomicrobium]|uniref:UDP-N-acetyl-D-mannosamine dehydrogenase n=1 Tax=Rhodomicrobium TaxID=1068 RepID=UPI000B4A9E72|nr:MULTISPECIES: UDP-N-acetyl-D-mannosamine dehydrogenase [Rhodomicrobium]
MRPDFPKVCILGLGYIGLPTAALIAGRGLKVTGVDVNAAVVATVGAGNIHIVETDLAEEVRRAVQSGCLTARETPEPADVFMIAVPTPLSSGKKPVLDYVFSAAHALAPHLKPGDLVILESTSPVGTTERICQLLADRRPDLTFPLGGRRTGETDLAVAYCPERVLPGRILKELVENDRCVGGMSPNCTAKARRFYELFVRGNCIETGARTAEMVKLTENAFRDTNIAFANELSMICDRLDINVWELIELANLHPRVEILKPGPGVGGHCIAVDPWFIVDACPDEAQLIRTAREVNDDKAHYVLEKICTLIEAHPDRPVSCLGLAFKANVDDLRESPALSIVETLAEIHGDRIGVVEPFIDRLPDTLTGLGVRLQELDQAVAAKGLLILLVDHEAFRQVDESRLAGAVLYDTRGIWDSLPPTADQPVRAERSAPPRRNAATMRLQ